MKITPNQNFKHDKESYEEGQEYEVSDELAAYFKFAGWVNKPKAEPTGEAATLDVHSSTLGQASKTN